jgi:hypothetical protein
LKTCANHGCSQIPLHWTPQFDQVSFC